MLTTIIVWTVFGLVVGALARLLVPGRQPIGLVGTIALGIGGSFLGGFVANLIQGYPILALHTVGFIGSLLGAILLLLLVVGVRRRRFA